MTTRYITLSAGTSKVMTTSVTAMQIFMEIKQTFKAIKSHLKGPIIEQNLKLMIIKYHAKKAILVGHFFFFKSIILLLH